MVITRPPDVLRVLQNQVTMITTMVGTFGVKNDLKVYTYHDIRSRYRGHLHSGKRANKFGQGPPLIRAVFSKNSSFL